MNQHKNLAMAAQQGIVQPFSLRTQNMLLQHFNLRNLMAKFKACLRDERGVAMTEYLLITAIILPLAIYLFHPDNGFYKSSRDQYNLTCLLLMFPGP